MRSTRGWTALSSASQPTSGGEVPPKHLLRSQLFGVTALDPSTYAAAAALLAVVVLLGGVLPARAATRVDPVGALRAE